MTLLSNHSRKRPDGLHPPDITVDGVAMSETEAESFTIAAMAARRNHGSNDVFAAPGHRWGYIHLFAYLDGAITWSSDPAVEPGPGTTPRIASIIVTDGQVLVRTFSPMDGSVTSDSEIDIER